MRIGAARGVLLLAVLFFAFVALHEGVQDLLLRLQVRVLAEQRVLVELEPLFRLNASPAQVDQIDEHGEEENDQGDDYDDLEHLCVRGSRGGLRADLNVGRSVSTIENCVVGESRQGTLSKRHLFVLVDIVLCLRLDSEHALSGWGDFVGEVRAEHIIGGVHIVLERIFGVGNHDVDGWHGVEVSFVAVARVGVCVARVQSLAGVLSLFVAGVRWDHKGACEIVVEVLWQDHFATVGVNCDELLLELLFHGWDVVLDLEVEVECALVDSRRSEDCGVGLGEHIVLCVCVAVADEA